MPNNLKIFYNAKIHTMDKENNIFEAIAIKGNKIISLGTNEEILSLENSLAKLYDLEGKVVIPGIIDTHTHLFWSALSELREEIFVPTSVRELLEHVRLKVKQLPEGQWIYLRNTYPTRLKDYRYPTINELDSVAPNNPIYIDGAYAGQVNNCALKIAGIDENTKIPGTGRFIKDKNTGKLTGLFFGCNNIFSRYVKKNEFNISDYKKAVMCLQKKYNNLGITSVIDGASDINSIKAVNELFEANQLSLRISYTKVLSGTETVEDICSFKETVKTPHKWGNLVFCKAWLDGGILTGTSYMREAYTSAPNVFGINFSGFHGIINSDINKLIKQINLARQSDLQMTAHCIGDAAIDLLLGAYGSCHDGESITDKRYAIIHGDFTDGKTLDRIKELNLSLLFQPAWHYKDGGILSKTLSKDTMKTFMPYRNYIEHGIRAAAGSDHMIKYDPFISQNPYNPFIGMYNMITRKTAGGMIIGPDQAINRDEALRMYTINAAWATFEEELKGSLEIGKAADFAVLSEDYFSCSIECIPNITSYLTVIGGTLQR
jgi:predicted amidohydrolase YtcJ